MPSSNYVRGRAFEYRARDALKKRGAAYVMRAAQSKGIVDLLAMWPHRWCSPPHPLGDQGLKTPARPWLVQCKYSINGGGRLPAHEEIELVALAELTGAIPVLARPGKNGRGVEFINLHTKELLG